MSRSGRSASENADKVQLRLEREAVEAPDHLVECLQRAKLDPIFYRNQFDLPVEPLIARLDGFHRAGRQGERHHHKPGFQLIVHDPRHADIGKPLRELHPFVLGKLRDQVGSGRIEEERRIVEDDRLHLLFATAHDLHIDGPGCGNLARQTFREFDAGTGQVERAEENGARAVFLYCEVPTFG